MDLKFSGPSWCEIKVLKAMNVKSTVSWDITPCNVMKSHRRFRATHYLHLRGRTVEKLAFLLLEPVENTLRKWTALLTVS
jgi:hypothetical protein